MTSGVKDKSTQPIERARASTQAAPVAAPDAKAVDAKGVHAKDVDAKDVDATYAGTSKASVDTLTPAPALTGGKRVLDLMLAGDKQRHIEPQGEDTRKLRADEAFAKHVGRLLLLTPHAAPLNVILHMLQADPQVAARYPKLILEDLNELHNRFPAHVPLPSLPVDFGAVGFPTVDGYIDLYLSKFMLPRASAVDAGLGIRGAAWGYWQSRYLGARGEQDFPALHAWTGTIDQQVGKLRDDEGRAGLFLRRLIQNAPPTWGPKEISEAFNKDLEFYAAVGWYGDKDTIEAARERTRMTPERVRAIMEKHPHQSCAAVHADRQKRLRDTLAKALAGAAPDENLYALLERVCAQLAESEKPARPRYDPNDVYRRVKRVPQPPSPTATLTPEDLAAFLAQDAAGQAALERFTSARRGTLDRALAQGIVDTIGPKLARTSFSEVVRIMRGVDASYNDDVVRHLFASFPELFPAARVETSKVEANFLLANQVADAMDRIFPGATLKDVADFLLKTNPTFASTVPDFSAVDVKLLQAAYNFLPRWEVKPEGATATQGDRLSLDSVLVFAARALGTQQKDALRDIVLESLDEGLRTGKVPPRLEAALHTKTTQALVRMLTELTGLRAPLSMEAAPLRALMEGGSVPSFLDEKWLRDMIGGKNGCERPDLAAPLARAIACAMKLDFAGLEEALDALGPPSPKMEMVRLKVANLALSYDGLLARIERDVFRDAALKASYERFARIPLRLPLVQRVVDKYADKQPLKDTNVLMVQHMLGQAYPQIAGYKALGMNTEDAIFVGIPYHKNEEVEQAVAKSFGMDVRVPAKDMEALYQAIEKAVDDLVAKHKENGKPCLIVCDGPYAREYFMKKYPELAGTVRFTEQTAFGDRPEHRQNKSIRVVSYARTKLKAREAEFVGQSVSRAVSRVMNQLKTGYEHKPVLILGTGSIGIATANAFAGDGAKVYVYDPKPTEEAIALAKEKGWTLLTDKSEIAKGKFLMIGCSGFTSIDEEQILASDDNAIYVSASSKLVEINMKKLRELATDDEGNVRRVLAAEVNDQQTWHYWLKDGTIRTVIADGLPANFNDINVVPPEFIDMTMALSLAAAVETMTGEDLGFYDLNAEDHDELDAEFNAFLEQLDVKAALAAHDG